MATRARSPRQTPAQRQIAKLASQLPDDQTFAEQVNWWETFTTPIVAAPVSTPAETPIEAAPIEASPVLTVRHTHATVWPLKTICACLAATAICVAAITHPSHTYRAVTIETVNTATASPVLTPVSDATLR